ncbi:unnamed protein product, partial [Allacma fusca]
KYSSLMTLFEATEILSNATSNRIDHIVKYDTKIPTSLSSDVIFIWPIFSHHSSCGQNE